MKIFLSALIICLAGLVHAMDARQVIERMQKVYRETPSFDYTCRYELFKGHKSNDVFDSYAGYMCRSKSGYYQKIDQSEFIYANDFFLKINHEEKAMLLDLPQKNIQLNADFDAALKNCSALKMEESEEHYEIIFLIKITSAIPYSVIRLRIDKKDYQLLRMDLYYTSAQDFSKDKNKPDFQQPHLRISFDKLNTRPKIKSGLFELATYLSKVNNILKPAGAYAGYDLIDTRIK